MGRRVFYLSVNGHLLHVFVDAADDKTEVWFAHSPHGMLGVLEHLRQAICKDFAQHICVKQRGMISVGRVVQFSFELTDKHPLMSNRRDHVLLLQNTSQTLARPQVFPALLKIVMYTPHHNFINPPPSSV